MEADKDSASEVENKDPQKPRGRPGRRWKFFKQPRNTPAEDLGKLTVYCCFIDKLKPYLNDDKTMFK